MLMAATSWRSRIKCAGLVCGADAQDSARVEIGRALHPRIEEVLGGREAEVLSDLLEQTTHELPLCISGEEVVRVEMEFERLIEMLPVGKIGEMAEER